MAKTVATPIDAYEAKYPLWKKCRAVCGGEHQVKEHDLVVTDESNFLIPFSPSMTQDQYDFLKREAELPGISAQFSRMLVGGLLRKKPIVELPDNAPAGAVDWINNEFAADDSSISSFLDLCLWEEVQTSRAWLFVTYPELEKDENGEFIEPGPDDARRPYPILYPGEVVINWKMASGKNGKEQLVMAIVAVLEEAAGKSEFHDEIVQKFLVHELVNGIYQVRKFAYDKKKKEWYEEDVTIPLKQSKPLNYIPGWPLNGSIEPVDPLLLTIVNKEIALYNKLTRRNHLLYGAATYTPVLKSDMDDTDFNKVVNAGLGSWVKIGKDDELTTLETPTEALSDLETAIANGIEEIAKLGIRMLTPETDQSGVALHLRNAAQTAQLGTLNAKISVIMKQVICMMLNWRYGTEYTANEIVFELSDDFSQTPLGADWVRLATEWYENGYIPRSVWLIVLRQNDMLPPDYDDVEGQKEIDEERKTRDEFQTYSDTLEGGDDVTE